MSIADNLARIRERMAAACARAGPAASDVELVAVSKRHPASAIREAYAAGQRCFGENYMQELAGKAEALSDLEDIRWRMIGALQRNKAGAAVKVGCAVDAIESFRVAEALDRRAREAGKRLQVMIEVNLGERVKAGAAWDQVDPLVAQVRALDALDLRGLFAIPPHVDDVELNRPLFRKLRERAQRLALPELSMGMSDDFEVAIEEGATMVRVGTAIFGPRL